MKVFISWSNDRSKAAAAALREWLPYVIQFLEGKIWVSSEDLDAGTRWSKGIAEALEATKFGIICITRENQAETWINFEAGALSKTLEKTFVVPYLIDMTPSDLKGPLVQFQAVRADMQGTLSLLKTLNKALEPSGISEHQIQTAFNAFWPTLEEKLKNLPSSNTKAPPERTEGDVMREILDTIRGLARTLPTALSEQKELLRQLTIPTTAKPIIAEFKGELTTKAQEEEEDSPPPSGKPETQASPPTIKLPKDR